jgi:hypothetical protein
MTRKNPLGKIKDVATDAAVTVVGTVTETVKHPIGTGQKVVGTAVGQAAAVAGAVSAKVPGRRKRAEAPRAESRPAPAAEPQDEPRKTQGDPVKPAGKAPAKKAAKKSTAKKAPAKKAPAKKTAAKTAAKKAVSAADLAAGNESEVTTPVGTTGAAAATNPDTTETDLQQVGTEPLMDPSLTNQIKSEAETAARGSDVEKG